MNGVVATEREIYALKIEPKRYERAVTQARGLSVLVSPNGIKSFVVRYRAEDGARRRIPIGDFPALNLVDARLKASRVRIQVYDGRDPMRERAQAREEARFGETFDQLAARYWEAAAIGLHGGRKRPLRPHTIARQKSLWKARLSPKIGSRRFKEFRRADVRTLMESFVLEGKLSASSIASIGDVVRALFALALHEDLIDANPTFGVTRPITPQSRSRLFSDHAMGVILGQLQDASNDREGRSDPHARLEATSARALRLMIFTLTRRTEVTAARWSEIDLAARVWIIPPERSKNRKFHVVPLSPEAMDVLHEARRNAWGDYVFPAARGAQGHMDTHAATRAISRICARHGLPHGSPHDFRRTGATVLTGEVYRVRRFIVGQVLGHTPNDGAAVTAVYDRNEYLAEKREALNAWGRHLIGLLVAPEPEVPPITRRHLRLVSAQ